MDNGPDSPLLSAAERPAAVVRNADGRGRAVLVCEHASRTIPAALNGLGLSAEAGLSHAAWDIGARDVAEGLSRALDAPLVESRISRLVYDCNRPPEAPDAMPPRSERFDIPGNEGLSEAQRAARVREVFDPFSALLAQVIADRTAPPVLITVHSFTPVYLGRRREVQIGILHDTDTRLADAMLDVAVRHTGLIVRRNEPYGPDDGVTYTLRRHGIAHGLVNVMIEIRNDLLSAEGDRADMAAMLSGWLTQAIDALDQPGKRTP